MPWYIGWPLLALFAYGVLWFFAQRAVYFPMKHPQGFWNTGLQAGLEDVWITTRDGVRLHAWFAPAETGVVTLFLHGNAGNITHRLPLVEIIPQAGSALLLLDYRGYGRSEGSPSETGLYADAEAGYEYLLARGYQPGSIVVHGESLGTAVAVDLAARREVGAVVLQAPFSSASEMAGRLLPVVGPLVMRSYNTISKIPRVKAPLLVVHGDRDDIVPHEQGMKLFNAAPEPKTFWTVPGARHNDLLEVAGADYTQRLRHFYATAGLNPGARAGQP